MILSILSEFLLRAPQRAPLQKGQLNRYAQGTDQPLPHETQDRLALSPRSGLPTTQESGTQVYSSLVYKHRLIWFTDINGLHMLSSCVAHGMVFSNPKVTFGPSRIHAARARAPRRHIHMVSLKLQAISSI